MDTGTTPHKVHIRGVDDLTTNDIRNFSAEHYPSHPPVRIEWIDDTSVNVIFEDPAIASEALESLTIVPQGTDYASIPLTQTREAKRLSSHSLSVLQVRIALSTDQKGSRAHEASRFYMLHPEHDPREQRRQYGKRRPNGTRDYETRRYSEQEHRRRKIRDLEEGFSASMYDDDGISSGRCSVEFSSDKAAHGRPSSTRRQRDSYRLARDQSASPERESTNRHEWRHRTPPPSYRSCDPHPFPADNKGKELFPTMSAATGNLSSNRTHAADLKKELFPQKANAINHRRSDAFDAADDTAGLFASGLSVPFEDGARNPISTSRKIRNGRTSEPNDLSKEPTATTEIQSRGTENGLIIRGASDHTGFSIRGASAVGTIKELFPGKDIGNGGKELFSEKLLNRGGRRNRAEDMFH